MVTADCAADLSLASARASSDPSSTIILFCCRDYTDTKVNSQIKVREYEQKIRYQFGGVTPSYLSQRSFKKGLGCAQHVVGSLSARRWTKTRTHLPDE